MDVLMVGMALDTNGQKARYVEAARKWGNDPDVVRALIAGDWDGAGIPARYAAASADHPGLAIRSAHKAVAYFDFPLDIRWGPRTDAEVRKLADEADVIHLTNDVQAYFRLYQYKKRKPGVLHHHGTLLRNQTERLRYEARRCNLVEAVSTHDLLRYAPDAHWLPTCYDLDALAKIREQHRRPDDGRIRIVSAPTNAEYKSTEALKVAVAQLQSEGLPVDLVLVTYKTWAECLEIKATADIYFDQVKLGYGCNAVEAWGMGIPVVAGADDWTLARMREEFDDDLPFVEATEDTIAATLRELVGDPVMRKRYADRGQRHAMRYHAEKPVMVRLAKLYALAVEKMAATPVDDVPEEFPLTAGTFRSSKPRAIVRVKNQTYRFREDDVVVISSPELAQAMRAVARYQPAHGISEVLE